MAEYVSLRMEDMIPELKEIKKLGLLDKAELRGLVKRRKEFEFKIQRRSKSKEDYLRYIEYEMDVLKLVKNRKEKLGSKYNKSEAEYPIAHRIYRLFKTVVSKFKDDVALWISYLKFCKQLRFQSHIGPALSEMLAVHSDKPNLWAFAANWEYVENHSVENARQYLLRGLRFHPTSKELYCEAFKLELHYTASKRKQQQQKMDVDDNAEVKCVNSGTSRDSQDGANQDSPDEIPDQVLEGRLAEMIFESAMKKVHDIRLLNEFLAITKQYDFTDKLEKKIVNYLMVNFQNDELAWDTIARRELEGISCSDVAVSEQQEGTSSADSMGGEGKKKGLKERIRACCAVYASAVSRLYTERMWSLYLELLLELNQDQCHLKNFKRNLLRDALQSAHSANNMQEKYYLIWVDMLKATGKFKKLENVLRSATTRYPLSVELWQANLRLYISKDDEDSAQTVFKEGITKLGCDNRAALPLWKIMLQYYHTKDMSKVEKMFQKAVVQRPAISIPLKPMYIEWLVLAKGIGTARKEYERLSSQFPLCLDLHYKMASLEIIQPTIKLSQVRKCHERACNQFGQHNTDVWMEYIKFEQKHGERKRVTEIYARAVKNLDPSLTDNFMSEFSMAKTGHAIPPDALIPSTNPTSTPPAPTPAPIPMIVI